MQTPQERSEQALSNATEAQERATEQANRAAEARAEVQRKQQELQAAQERARQEQARAEQLQRDANQMTQQATSEAQRAQQQATQALSQQGRMVEQGVMTVRGQVSRASAGQLVVKPGSGDEMAIQVTGDTQVQIDGRQASAADIQPGENAVVSYEVSGTQPTARSIQVVTGNPAPTSSGRTAPSSAPADAGGETTGTRAPSGTTPQDPGSAPRR